MAQRRMFSTAITNSAKFLKMPLETQALYFHLAQNADDDGVVEGFTIMRLIGASEDSLKVLQAKQYIHILNEDLVVFVIDWLEHNKLRADRKKDSIYKDLLLETLPNVVLLNGRDRKDRPKNKKDVGTSQGQPSDNQVSGSSQAMDGIGEVRIGEDSLGKVSEEEQKTKVIVDFYNSNIGLITPFIFNELNTFIDDGIESKLILECIKIACTNNAKSWVYIKAILNSCVAEKILTLEQFNAKEKEFEKKKSQRETKNTTGAPDNMTNFKGRNYSDDEYEKFYSNL